ncbi:MAG: hypothetical protein WB607_16580 [Candidatus Acidiferrum sp.]
MSEVYVLRPPKDPTAISNSSFIGGIDFGADESGEYVVCLVISMRIPSIIDALSIGAENQRTIDGEWRTIRRA